MEYRWIALEPVQILQSLLASPVTLVTGRPFLVRGYVQLTDFFQEFSASLEVTIYDQNNDTVDYCVKSLDASLNRTATARLSKSNPGIAEYTQLCRNSLDNSINWLVKPEDFANELQRLAPGMRYFLRLDAIAVTPQEVGTNSSSKISNAAAKNRPDSPEYLKSYANLVDHAKEFGKDFGAFYITGDTGLRLNTIGLRYFDPDGEDAFPVVENHQFARARSYLAASFPVGKLDWTSLNVNAPVSFGPPFVSGQRAGTDLLLQNRIDTANAFVAALRANDIGIANYTVLGEDTKSLAGGVAADTFYYGMMNAAGNVFEGAASDVPKIPTRKTVATGPADNTSGYYCAHELGHMLGQTHSGGTNQRAENFNDWLTRPRLASNARRDDLLLSMDRNGQKSQRLAWSRTYDLMSYGEQTWPSSQTLYELRTQLDKLHAQSSEYQKSDGWVSGISGDTLQTDYVFVTGVYDLISRTGRLLYALPLKRNSLFESEFPQAPQSEADVRKRRASAGQSHSVRAGIALILHTDNPDGDQLIIPGERLNLRRENLDFPGETGMFQVLISRRELLSFVNSSSKGDNCLLTLVQYTAAVGQAETVSAQDISNGKSHQLHQIALRGVPNNEGRYQRIRPSEINLEQSEEQLGFNLRIDKQLAANELVDCSFIIEACSPGSAVTSGESATWRTLALNARVGEDIFLDGREDSALQLTEPVHQQADMLSGDQIRIGDERLRELLGIGDATRQRLRLNEVKQALETLAIMVDGSLYARRSSIFVARIRIVASLGLERVIVFDGLLEQCATVNRRTICQSVDRNVRFQGFNTKDAVSENDRLSEDARVDILLQKSRQILSTMEILSTLGLLPSDELHVRDLLTVVAGLHNCTVDPRISSNEFTLQFKEADEAAVDGRTVYYSIK